MPVVVAVTAGRSFGRHPRPSLKLHCPSHTLPCPVFTTIVGLRSLSPLRLLVLITNGVSLSLPLSTSVPATVLFSPSVASPYLRSLLRLPQLFPLLLDDQSHVPLNPPILTSPCVSNLLNRLSSLVHFSSVRHRPSPSSNWSAVAACGLSRVI